MVLPADAPTKEKHHEEIISNKGSRRLNMLKRKLHVADTKTQLIKAKTARLLDGVGVA